MKRLLPAVAALLFAGAALAQSDFPNRTVTMLVGFAPGGATDTAARIIAKKLAENIGQSVVVENKAGAGGNIAHQAVAIAPPDGYTILLGSVGPLAVAPHLIAKLPYDPLKDLAPLTMAVNFPNVLVVHTGVPATTLAEYVALAKAKPGGLDYASTGVGSASHLAGELFNQRAGVDIVHIPYKGGGPAMTDLLGGRVGAYYSTPFDGRAAHRGRQAARARRHGPEALLVPAQRADDRRIRLSGLRGDQLVRLRDLGQGPRADPRPPEQGTGQGAQCARREGAASPSTSSSPAPARARNWRNTSRASTTTGVRS